MVKPFDISKFRKDITKSIDGLGIGFRDPTDWISTGNYALNYLVSGDFYKGIPLGKVTGTVFRCILDFLSKLVKIPLFKKVLVSHKNSSGLVCHRGFSSIKIPVVLDHRKNSSGLRSQQKFQWSHDLWF